MTKGGKTKLFTIAIAAIFAATFLYRYFPYKIEFLGHYDKIWAHRANSKQKLQSALQYFDGVELDLVYNEEKDFLDVNHPPAESINLHFEEYFSAIPKNSEPYLWLDIKTLNSKNAPFVLKKLLQVFSERNYPLQKVLVETRNPEALPIFQKAGFKTSYYLPPGISNFENTKLTAEIDNIKNVLQNQSGLAISSNYEDYKLMSKYFPSTAKYIWIINSVTVHGFSQPQKILKDPTVKAVLISYKPFNGNR